jgi:hypothetical protein
LAKTPRPPISNDKDRGKGKGKEKADTRTKKGGEEQGKETPTVHDFHDGSINSLAVRCSLLCGYEQFKVRSTISMFFRYSEEESASQLTHGSFTRILSTLGKEALELQLERFFTVWAWSWNIEDGHEFGPHLGESWAISPLD